MKHDYKVQLKYKKAWRSKEKRKRLLEATQMNFMLNWCLICICCIIKIQDQMLVLKWEWMGVSYTSLLH